jgi:uncharacterized membrane protein YhaH (DUF805 family)
MDNIDFAHLFFQFDGRINRAKFWLGLVVIWLIELIVGTVFGFAVYIIVAIVAIWPGLAISIKRWHDRDKSGWWVLIAFIPIIGWIWALIETGFLPGTDGPNRYGPDPLGGTVAETA